MNILTFLKRIFRKKNKSKLLFEDLQSMTPDFLSEMTTKYGDKNFFDIRESITRYQSPNKPNNE